MLCFDLIKTTGWFGKYKDVYSPIEKSHISLGHLDFPRVSKSSYLPLYRAKHEQLSMISVLTCNYM